MQERPPSETAHVAEITRGSTLFFDQHFQLLWQTTRANAPPESLLAGLLLGPDSTVNPTSPGIAGWSDGTWLVQHARFELGLALRREAQGRPADEHWRLVDALWTRAAGSARVRTWLFEQARRLGLDPPAATEAASNVLQAVEEELLPVLHLRAAICGGARKHLAAHTTPLLRGTPPRRIPQAMVGLWSRFFELGLYKDNREIEAAWIRVGLICRSPGMTARSTQAMLSAFGAGLTKRLRELPRRERAPALATALRRLVELPPSAALCDLLAEEHAHAAAWRLEERDEEGALRVACTALALDPHCREARVTAAQAAAGLGPRKPQFAEFQAGLARHECDAELLARVAPHCRELTQVRVRAVVTALAEVAAARAILNDSSRLVSVLCESIQGQKDSGSLRTQAALLFEREAALDAPTLVRELGEADAIDPEIVYLAVRRASPARLVSADPSPLEPPTVAAAPRAHAIRSWLMAPIDRGFKLIGVAGLLLMFIALPGAIANHERTAYIALQTPLYAATLAARRDADDAALLTRARAFLFNGRDVADDPRIEQVRAFLSDAALGEVVRLVETGDEAGAAALLELHSRDLDVKKEGVP